MVARKSSTKQKEMAKPKKRMMNEVSEDEQPAKRPRIFHRSHQDVGGEVFTLGEGDTGQLGLGEDIMERMRPAKVNIPGDVVQVCAGGMHTVCLTKGGEVYTFGCNDEGALGRDTSEDGSETRPGKVDLDCRVVLVSAGDSHTAALSDDGRVFAWGIFRDSHGKMGLTVSEQQQPTPVEFVISKVVVKIASGSDHLVCLTRDGYIFTCGCAEQGQLGRVAEYFAQRGGRKGLGMVLSPALVRCMRHKSRKKALFSDIWTGQHYTLAEERETGDIYGWGLNNYCQLGLSDVLSCFLPVKLPSFQLGKKWQAMTGGLHHTISLDSDGKVYTLGRSDYGRLGLGEGCGDKDKPTLVPELQSQTCTLVAAGTTVSFAVTREGKLYSWGMGTSKQLASGEEDDEYSPIVMSGKQLSTRNGISISAGGQHTVILAKTMEDEAAGSGIKSDSVVLHPHGNSLLPS